MMWKRKIENNQSKRGCNQGEEHLEGKLGSVTERHRWKVGKRKSY